MIGSKAQEMKSANWNSTTGRRPTRAAPAASPVNPVSAIGVSTTRRSPNFSRKPLVTLKAPPNWPTSSPMRNTDSSASISAISAWVAASREATSVSGLDPLLLPVGRGHGIGERLLAGVDADLPGLVAHLLDLLGGGEALLLQLRRGDVQRVLLRPLLEHLPRHVVGRVVL